MRARKAQNSRAGTDSLIHEHTQAEKEAKRRKAMGWDDEYMGYSNAVCVPFSCFDVRACARGGKLDRRAREHVETDENAVARSLNTRVVEQIGPVGSLVHSRSYRAIR